MTRVLIVLVAALALIMPVHASPAGIIVIEGARLVPPVLNTMTGERVTFVNRSGRAAHVEFHRDGGEHHLVQVQAGGPIWAVFYRPGRHAYVVHMYAGRRTETLAGAVEVVDDAVKKPGPPVCAVNVMGVCIEP